ERGHQVDDEEEHEHVCTTPDNRLERIGHRCGNESFVIMSDDDYEQDITDDSDDVQSMHFGLSDEHRNQYGSALNHILADDRNT
ncbi:unnamed protein product, partial [Rotaria magnacalcarata]